MLPFPVRGGLARRASPSLAVEAGAACQRRSGLAAPWPPAWPASGAAAAAGTRLQLPGERREEVFCASARYSAPPSALCSGSEGREMLSKEIYEYINVEI